MKHPRLVRSTIAMLLLIVGLTTMGCSPPRDDLEILEEMTRRQAAHQDQILRQSQNLTEASQQLVEQDAQARHEFAEMQSAIQHGIAAERQNLDQQKVTLDDERREIAAQRYRDPLIAAAILQSATLAIACVPIVLILAVLRASHAEATDIALHEVLLEEFVSESPRLLPALGYRLEHQQQSAEPAEAKPAVIGSVADPE